jgi:putative membrane protein
MKYLPIAFILVASFACNRSQQTQDNNRAEPVATKEEADRKNSETNEEVSSGAVNDKDSTGVSISDKAFVTDAANAGLTEVRLGKLAAERGSTPKVKEFANMMVKDHTAANDELKKLAERMRIAMPQDLCSECLAKYNGLSNLRGAQFDKKYMEMMVSDHREAVQKFSNEADKGKDSELQAWAKGKLPVLKHHLSMSESVAGTTSKAK